MYQRVLVGTDGSPTAMRAVMAAAALARAHNAQLVIAHAFSPRPRSRDELAMRQAPEEVRWRLTVGAIAEATVQRAVDRAKESVRDGAVLGRCEPGSPVTVLLALVDEFDPDVLVVGNRDMRGWARAHRSVGRSLSRRAACDVVIVDTVGRRAKRRTALLQPDLRLA